MKKLEIAIKGKHEEEMWHEMLSGICGLIRSYRYMDVSVRMEISADEGEGGVQILGLLRQHGQGRKGGKG